MTDTSNWMAAMPDDIRLSDMTIPGTHDSAAYARLSGAAMQALRAYYQCQDKDLQTQLADGIRFFDLRGYAEGDRIGFCHGDKIDPRFDLWFDDALNIFRDFLASHPREAIIISAKCDYRDANQFASNWNNHYWSQPHNWYTGEYFPKLGDVRGKIFAIPRTAGMHGSVDVPRWDDDSTDAGGPGAWIVIQDWYQVNIDYANKSRAVDDQMDKALSSNDGHYHLNFISCISDWNGKPGFPRDAAMSLNVGHMQTLMRRPFGRWGVLIMDFYNEGSDAGRNVVAQISSNLRLRGDVPGWYRITCEVRGNNALDSNSNGNDPIKMTGYNNDCTTWQLVDRDNDGYLKLKSRAQNSFLDANCDGERIYLTNDNPDSTFKRWKLESIPGTTKFYIINKARAENNGAKKYLDANSKDSPYVSEHQESEYTRWRLSRTIW
jgi:1-phosphatidylinositol phosphodiesterase